MEDDTTASSHNGHRAKALLKAFDSALSKTMESSKWDVVTEVFAELIPSRLHDYMGDLYQQFLTNIENSSREEFFAILGENNVIERLNALDKDCNDVSENQPRRCTQANDVADATETPNKTAFREHLENTITVLRKQNQELEARIHTMKQSMTQQSCRDGCDVEASSIRSQKHDSDADNRLYPYTARLAKAAKIIDQETTPDRQLEFETLLAKLG
eukprot:gene10166-2328_t